MSLFIILVVNLCIINLFIFSLIYFYFFKNKNKRKINPEFFGICLNNDVKGQKKIMNITLKKGYYLHINNILPGYSFETNNLILKLKTKKMNQYISVYQGNAYDWKPIIDLKFGEDDEYISFEYNTKVYLSGFYIPI